MSALSAEAKIKFAELWTDGMPAKGIGIQMGVKGFGQMTERGVWSAAETLGLPGRDIDIPRQEQLARTAQRHATPPALVEVLPAAEPVSVAAPIEVEAVNDGSVDEAAPVAEEKIPANDEELIDPAFENIDIGDCFSLATFVGTNEERYEAMKAALRAWNPAASAEPPKREEVVLATPGELHPVIFRAVAPLTLGRINHAITGRQMTAPVLEALKIRLNQDHAKWRENGQISAFLWAFNEALGEYANTPAGRDRPVYQVNLSDRSTGAKVLPFPAPGMAA